MWGRFPPYGGYPVFVKNGLNENWLPVWLQAEGYNTYYTGKLFNSHSVHNHRNPPVNGFNGSDFLLDPYTYSYWKSQMSRNHADPVSYEGQYSPDVVAEKTYGWLDEAASHHDRPFFIVAAPIAPHSDQDPEARGVMTAPQYAPRHAHLFQDYQIPRTANFNPEAASGVSWVKNLAPLNESVVEYNDEYQRSRLRALQSVDEMVEQIVERLDSHGLLDTTYIIYTTDNGYHISQHRLPPGKECPFETDINVPLLIRGPGVPRGQVAGIVSSHTDLAPTILKLAGQNRPDLDGTPIPLSSTEAEQLMSPATSGEHVNIEFWGRALPEGQYGKLGDDPLLPGYPRVSARNNTYKALRIVAAEYSFLYTVWCTGERELYNMHEDPDQIHNLLDHHPLDISPANQQQQQHQQILAERSTLHQLSTRLDTLTLVLKTCKSHTCRKPWETLHPNGNVQTLHDALQSQYDEFYASQPRVEFSSCPLGYLLDEEGPQLVNVWNDEDRMDGERGGGWGQEILV